METQNRLLCEGLSSRGHTVVVFSPKWELNKTSICENGVTYVFIDCVYRVLFGLGALQKSNWLNRSVYKFNEMHKTAPFNVVLGQSSAALGVINNKEKIKIPVISISHGTIGGEISTRLRSTSIKTLKDFYHLIADIGYFLLNFFFRQRDFIRHSDKVIAVSRVVKEALIDETYVPEERVEVIYNGIRPPKFPVTVVQHREIRILYVGRVDKTKGLEDLLQAINSEMFSDTTLKIVGDGNYLEELKEVVSKEGLEGRVEFTGNVPHEEVLSFMNDSDIFVLPSRRVEGFPMTLVEAMFASLPIVGSDMGGIPEAITHGVTGYIYKSGNIDELKEKLTNLVKDSELRRLMGDRALEKAKLNYTLEAMLDKYEEVLRDEII